VIAEFLELGDARLVDVEAQRRQLLAEAHRERQTDIAETDHGDARFVRAGQGSSIHSGLRVRRGRKV
jgi:hypothetical protein